MSYQNNNNYGSVLHKKSLMHNMMELCCEYIVLDINEDSTVLLYNAASRSPIPEHDHKPKNYIQTGLKER